MLKKRILLGLLLLGATSSYAEAGIIAPGEITTDTAIAVPNGGVVIDQTGVYDVNNTAKTLVINNQGSAMNLFGINGGKEATVNGSINVVATDFYSAGTDIDNGTVNVNGDLHYAVDNSAVTIGNGSLLNVGTSNNSTTLNVKGNLVINNTVKKATNSMSIMTAYGKNTVVNVEGDLDFYNRIIENTGGTSSGANSLYANGGATINVKGNSTIYSICSDPDAITAKRESVINLEGTNNKVVGNLSVIEATGGYTLANGGTVTAVFDGSDSFWYGDEQVYVPFWKEGIIGAMTGLTNLGTVDFTFQNGAEYIYMGNDCYYDLNTFLGTLVAPCARAKFISAITLKNGGIVNLQDADIQNKFASIDHLLEVYPDLKTFKHDFFTIGDLKGSEGIFKMDLNVNDKTKSDMLFVEKSSDPGKHYIESSLTNQDLEQLSDTNKLRFATTAQAASGVSFAASKQSFSNTLMDYDILIGSESYSATDPENPLYNARYGGSGNEGDSKSSGMFQALLPTLDATYANGTNWFMYGVVKTPSKAALGMKTWADAVYGYAMTMGSLKNRLGNAQYSDNHASGLWANFKRRGFGAQDYSGTNSLGQIGYDKVINNNRIGIAFDYGDGKTNFSNVSGSSKHSRHGLTIYDTVTLPKDQYLDWVFRYGKINNDFTAYNTNGAETTSDYNNYVLSLSAEYGKRFSLGNSFFVEPEAQIQYAKLTSADYKTNTGIVGSVAGTKSLLGRIGFRAGISKNKTSDVYVTANWLHDFTDGQALSLKDGFSTLDYRVGERNSWYTVGLGGNFVLSRKHKLFFDLEKAFGSEDVKAWRTNFQYTYSF